MKKTISVLLLIMISIISIWGQTHDPGAEHSRNYNYIGYSLRVKQNSGRAIGGNALSYVTGTSTNSVGLLLTPNMLGNNDAWQFIPVGGNEPGWYYIRNASYQNSYLSGATSTGEVTMIAITDLNVETKKSVRWRLVKTEAYDPYSFPGLEPTGEPNTSLRWGLAVHFRLVTGGNMVLAQKDNKLIVVDPVRAAESNCYATIEIQHENSFSGKIPGVRNEDMEIVSNLQPISTTAITYPTLPATQNDFNTLNASGDPTKIYFPIVFSASDFSKTYLVYNYASSNELGNKRDYGYYFMRIKNGGQLRIPIVNESTNISKAIFQVSYWSRVATPTGEKPTNLPFVRKQDGSNSTTQDVGQVTAIPQAAVYNSTSGWTWTFGASYGSDPTPLAYHGSYVNSSIPGNMEDPDGWEFRKFNYENSGGLKSYTLGTVDNLMTTGDDVYIDIDNFNVKLVENWTMNYKFKNYILRIFGSPTTSGDEALDIRTQSNEAATRLYRNGANVGLSLNNLVIPDYYWNFIPVGGSEPGWYYIRNQGSGTYLQATNEVIDGKAGENLITVVKLANLANFTGDIKTLKWRLVKVNTYSSNVAPGVRPGKRAGYPNDENNPAAGRFFKLISKSGHMLAGYSNSGNYNNKHMALGALESSNIGATANGTATISIELQEGQNPIFNEDLELVSNYMPIPTNSTTYPELPSSLEEDFSPTIGGVHTDATDFFPVGFSRVIKADGSPEDVRLIHDFYSSGNADELGFYFVRIKNEGRLATSVNMYAEPTSGTTFRVNYRSRITTPTGEKPNPLRFLEDKNGNLATAKSFGQLTAFNRTDRIIPNLRWNTYSSNATPIDHNPFVQFMPPEEENNPGGWEYKNFNFPNADASAADGRALHRQFVAAIDNLMPQGYENYNEVGLNDVFVDIDNFMVSMDAYTTNTLFRYQNTDQTPQQVHRYTQDVFIQMPETGTVTKVLSAVTGGNSYSYYRWHVSEYDHPALQFVSESNSNPRRLGTAAGKIAFNYDKSTLYTASPTINFQVSEGLRTVYNTGEVITVTCDVSNYLDYTFTSPTVDNFNYILTEPKLSFRNHFRITPAWVCAQRINLALADGKVLEHVKQFVPNGSSLRIAPQYDLNNYYLNITDQIIKDGDDNIINIITPKTGEGMGLSFYWKKYTSIEDAGATNASPESIPSGATETTSRHLTITAPVAGSVDIYDCYVKASVGGSTIYRKVARFEITAVDKEECGPRLETTDTDLLGGIEHKKLLVEYNFDQTENRYNMGLHSLGISESSYGFVDPTYFGNGVSEVPTAGIIDQEGRGHGHQLAPYRYEYGFPKMINGGNWTLSNGGTSGYNWYGTVDIRDRSYTTTNKEKNGNMLYVDAGQIPGTIAELDIPESFCPGSTLYLSAWIVNLSADGSTSPNLTFLLKDKNTGIPMITYNTGNIDTKGQWYQIASKHEVEVSNVDFVLEIRNNGSNTTTDKFAFAIDDICIWASEPTITVKKIDRLCAPIDDNRVNDMTVSVTVDLEPMNFLSAESESLYFRFEYEKEVEKVTTLVKILDNGAGGNVYSNQDSSGGSVEDAGYYTYGRFALTGTDGDDVIYTDFDNTGIYLKGKVTFTQMIPSAIMTEAGETQFVVYVKNKWEDLGNTLSCAGQYYFDVHYDRPEFYVELDGSKVSPEDLSVCTNVEVTVGATVKNMDGNPLYTFYDWYYGPTYAKSGVEFDTYIENYEAYDPNLNLSRGFYERRVKFVGGTDNGSSYVYTTIEDKKDYDFLKGSTGTPQPDTYSVKEDLDAFRFFYPYPTRVRTYEKCWPVKTIIPTGMSGQYPYNKLLDCTSTEYAEAEKFGLTDPEYATNPIYQYIKTVEDLNALLTRMAYYTKDANNILYLHKKDFPLYFYSDAPYFLTVIPTNSAVTYNSDGTPNWSDEVSICSTPTETRIQAVTWASVAKYGEINDYGLPKMNYPDEEDESNEGYVYTVRLPEKMDGQSINDKFVVPFLYIDEIHKAALDLISVDGKYVNNSNIPELQMQGLQLSGVHFGVINPEQPNKLLTDHLIWATCRYNEATNQVDKVSPYLLTTYWDIDGDRDLKLYPESYPFIWNSYNYYNPTPKYPDFPNYVPTLEDEGNPYPIKTVLGQGNGLTPEQEIQNTITNNRLGLEVMAESLLRLIGKTSLSMSDLLTDDNKFKPGSTYIFRFRTTADNEFANEGVNDCDREYYFHVKVVPETVYYQGISDSWHDDNNWKTTENTAAFAPLRFTNTVMLSGMDKYPTLKDIDYNKVIDGPPSAVKTKYITPELTVTVNEDGISTPTENTTDTKFMEFDYNWKPNAANQIYFKMGSELGNQYFLDYDNAKVDLTINTLQWYGLSAPLRRMYSGDYSFERINPLADIRQYNTANPQTQAPSSSWTLSFNNVDVELEAGLGYSVRTGNFKFRDEAFYENPDLGVKNSNDRTDANIERLATVNYTFPKTAMSYPFYNQTTKAKSSRVDLIPSRENSGRFVYEIGNPSVVPQEDRPLVTIPVRAGGEIGEENGYMVIGNPFMAHLDFEKFYESNNSMILPEMKLLIGGNNYVSIKGIDEGNGSIKSIESTEDELTFKSIAPMQTFIVKLRNEVTSGEIKIERDMNVTEPALKLRSNQQSRGIRIKAERGGLSTSALVILTDLAANNAYRTEEDSRKMLIEGVSTAPSIFTITDNIYLDINRMREFPASLPIGISTTVKGEMNITITGIKDLAGEYNFYFRDTERNIRVDISDYEEFHYEFDNTTGNVLGRLYIEANKVATAIDPIKSETISIYTDHNILHILSNDASLIKSLEITNISGQVIHKKQDTNKTHIEIPLMGNGSAYVIKVLTETSSVIEKVIIK